MNYPEDFLTANGFRKEGNLFVNNLCTITVFKNYFGIKYGIGEMFSDNKNLYWLIGFLTFHELMDKNYVI